MRKQIPQTLPLLCILLFGCILDNRTTSPDQETGSVQILLKLEKIGTIHKLSANTAMAAIEMDTLHLILHAPGEDTLRNAIPLAGNGMHTVSKTYSDLPSLKTWTLAAVARDQRGATVYSGSVDFIVPVKKMIDVSLNLSPRYSMLKGRFFPIRDSVTRVELRVDGDLVADSVFPKQSLLGDTVVLRYDYLSASPVGEAHSIGMAVFGDMWGIDTLLYSGDTTFTVFSGKDTAFALKLYWVGPGTPPPGMADISVSLGALGAVTLDGLLEDTVVASWKILGMAGFTPDGAEYTSLTVSSTGVPYLAFMDKANGFRTTVMRWSGSAWDLVGAPGFSAGVSLYTSLALSNEDVPYVAFRDGGNGSKATVMRFNGSAWETVGTPGFSAGVSNFTSLALSGTGVPYVAFRDGGNGGKATVMRFNGGGWEYLGTPGFSVGGANTPSLALSENDLPFVAFRDDANLGKATVMRWTGSTWEIMGTPGFSAGDIWNTSLSLSGAGIPYVAFQDGGNGWGPTVMKWNGNAWENVGAPGLSTGEASWTSLEVSASGVPYVAFSDDGIEGKTRVMKWSGSIWENVGSPGISAGATTYTTLALSNTGIPYVAYMDRANQNRATVMGYYP